MALATKCPYCQTTFRVAHDQLKLRAGLVRCGACKEIFNGIEHLLRPAQPPVPLASGTATDATTPTTTSA
ncbi:MAG: zinc-ribbon domain-containing protein, partial [Pseudomonadota bacterium]|nr:zinc-ribbon domain-containing protein [Pseudomonadota bacterium]